MTTSTAAPDPAPAACPETGSTAAQVQVTGNLLDAPTVTFPTPLTATRVETATPIASTGEGGRR